jgi:hypothetical protein
MGGRDTPGHRLLPLLGYACRSSAVGPVLGQVAGTSFRGHRGAASAVVPAALRASARRRRRTADVV